MTTVLQPPPERDLPPARREAVRAAVLRTTRPRSRRAGRRFTVGLALVAALVLAAAVLVPRLGVRPLVAEPATTPSPVPSATTGSSAPTPSPTSPPEPTPSGAPTPSGQPSRTSANPVDQGPLSSRARDAQIRSCQANLGRSTKVADVHFARQIAGDGAVVLFTGTDGLSYLCTDDESSLYDGPGSKTARLGEPTARWPVIRIMSPGIGGSGNGRGRVAHSTGAAYRVADDVATVELRLVVNGVRSPWFSTVVHDGYAYAAGRMVSTGVNDKLIPDVEVEDRAFDRSGHEVPIDRTPR